MVLTEVKSERCLLRTQLGAQDSRVSGLMLMKDQEFKQCGGS